MHTIYKSAIVPFSQQQMFDLVNDINSYPSFLNWCDNAIILEQNASEIIASIKINKAGFKQEFTTINTLVKNEKIIMNLKNGPFKNLDGEWNFKFLQIGACKIEFNLNFKFSSKIMDLTLSPAFSIIANSQLDSFVSRAKIVYG